MLTEELLTGVDGLTPEQVTAITTLSKNDEESVIGSKIGEIHGSYEKDILDLTGVQKNQGEKAYAYMKRVMSDFKTSSSSLAEEVGEYKAQIEALNKKMAEGGDAATLQRITDLNAQVEALTASRVELEGTHKAEKEALEGKFKQVQVNGEVSKSLAKLKFSSAYPENAIERNVAAVKADIFSKFKTEFDEKGTLIFRDEKGELLRDKDNGLNPMTLDTILSKELSYMLDKQPAQGGAGGQGGQGGGEGKGLRANIGGAKTQVEADALIRTALLGQGLAITDPKFHSESLRLRKENGVSELPMR